MKEAMRQQATDWGAQFQQGDVPALVDTSRSVFPSSSRRAQALTSHKLCRDSPDHLSAHTNTVEPSEQHWSTKLTYRAPSGSGSTSPLKSAIVLQSGASRPVTHISHMLRWLPAPGASAEGGGRRRSESSRFVAGRVSRLTGTREVRPVAADSFWPRAQARRRFRESSQ